MRGYFAIGIESISKAMNVGNLFRSAHAFGASFIFTVAAVYPRSEGAKADTSDAPGSVPFYSFPDVGSMVLPKDCMLVGVELTDDAIELPTFRHPAQAAYVMGPERGSLSPGLTEKCAFVVKIPARFSFNVGIAGAIVMYDRITSLGKFQRRGERPGKPTEALPKHVFGDPKIRNKMEEFRGQPPAVGEEAGEAG